MSKLISPRKRIEVTKYWRQFDWEDKTGCGFIFPCDKYGVVNTANFNDCARQNYAECLTGTVDGKKIVDKEITSSTYSYVEPATILCNCGKEVALHGFTNTCGCGADYNMSGHQLAPREQWGEETGESVSDILSVDSDSGWDY